MDGWTDGGRNEGREGAKEEGMEGGRQSQIFENSREME